MPKVNATDFAPALPGQIRVDAFAGDRGRQSAPLKDLLLTGNVSAVGGHQTTACPPSEEINEVDEAEDKVPGFAPVDLRNRRRGLGSRSRIS